MNHSRLTKEQVKDFLFGQTIDCFDPGSRAWVATIDYMENGTCRAEMANDVTDTGRYGFDLDLYWTQYSWFRDGGLFRFFLKRIDADTCQAHFEDGTKAFLQTIKK